MYDAICNVELIEPIMKNKLNYFLKPILLSLKNMYDIYNGSEKLSLSQDVDFIIRHFYQCKICQDRRGYICSMCNNAVKIFPFELKETKGCSKCKKLYHRKCLLEENCPCG